MADQQTPSPSNKKEEKKKSVLNRLQEITPDKDEQVALIGVAVRLGIVIWSEGKLSNQDYIRSEAERMLEDAKARSKVIDFFYHWLDLVKY